MVVVVLMLDDSMIGRDELGQTCCLSTKTGTRLIMRLDELLALVRLERRTQYREKFVQTDNPSCACVYTRRTQTQLIAQVRPRRILRLWYTVLIKSSLSRAPKGRILLPVILARYVFLPQEIKFNKRSSHCCAFREDRMDMITNVFSILVFLL